MKPSNEFDTRVKCSLFLVKFLSFEKVLIILSALTQDSQYESGGSVNSIEKSDLFGKSSPHFFVKSQPFSYQLVLNPHTVKTNEEKHMKYFQLLKREPSLLIFEVRHVQFNEANFSFHQNM